MLKIKDDVDLKELEKFGFEYEKAHGINSERYIYTDDCETQRIEVSVEDKEIFVEDISGSYYLGAIVDETLTVLYDLIQAGLVEKVKEE